MPLLLPSAGVPSAGVLPNTPVGGPKQIAQRTPRPQKKPPVERAEISLGGLRFHVPEPAAPTQPKRESKSGGAKVKNDPKLVAAARELRDRWLEQVNASAGALPSQGKYDVSRRQLAAPSSSSSSSLSSLSSQQNKKPTALLSAA